MTSLLDAARQLADWVPTTYTGISPRVIDGVSGWSRYECIVCLAETLKGHHTEIQHEPDCPWTALPKIVAVLEATERLIDPDDDWEPTTETDRLRCVFCSANMEDPPWGPGEVHNPDCAWQALAAALRGGEGEG